VASSCPPIRANSRHVIGTRFDLVSLAVSFITILLRSVNFMLFYYIFAYFTRSIHNFINAVPQRPDARNNYTARYIKRRMYKRRHAPHTNYRR